MSSVLFSATCVGMQNLTRVKFFIRTTNFNSDIKEVVYFPKSSYIFTWNKSRKACFVQKFCFLNSNEQNYFLKRHKKITYTLTSDPSKTISIIFKKSVSIKKSEILFLEELAKHHENLISEHEELEKKRENIENQIAQHNNRIDKAIAELFPEE